MATLAVVWDTIKALAVIAALLMAAVVGLNAFELGWLVKWVAIGLGGLAVLGFLGQRGIKADQEKLARAMADAGWLGQKGLPADVSRFQRTRSEKFRTDDEEVFRLQGDPTLWFVPLGDERWLFWKSKASRTGAFALRRRSGGGFNRLGKLIFIEPKSFPDGCARVDLACELPDGAPVFFESGVGESFKSLLGRDTDLEFEYQDGWCRLKVALEKAPPARLKSLVEALEEGLSAPNGSGDQEYSVVVREEAALDTDQGGKPVAIKIGYYAAKEVQAPIRVPPKRPDLPDGRWHLLGEDPEREETEPADGAQSSELREKFFSTTAEFLSVPGDRPHGLAIEAVGPKGSVTAVFLADGATSLYFSAGGGIVGAGEHDEIRKKVVALVAELPRYAGLMQAAFAHPEPTLGRVSFTILTSEGLLSAEDDVAALQEGSRPLSPLFAAGRELMSEVRALQAKMA